MSVSRSEQCGQPERSAFSQPRQRSCRGSWLAWVQTAADSSTPQRNLLSHGPSHTAKPQPANVREWGSHKDSTSGGRRAGGADSHRPRLPGNGSTNNPTERRHRRLQATQRVKIPRAVYVSTLVTDRVGHKTCQQLSHPLGPVCVTAKNNSGVLLKFQGRREVK